MTRKDVEIEEMGFTREDYRSFKMTEQMYGSPTAQKDIEKLDEEEIEMHFDPVLKYKKHKVTPQKFRAIEIGPEDMLKNG